MKTPFAVVVMMPYQLWSCFFWRVTKMKSVRPGLSAILVFVGGEAGLVFLGGGANPLTLLMEIYCWCKLMCYFLT